MHEFSPYRDFPTANESPTALWQDINSARGDHQWLWNQFWQHATELKGTLFFVNLGDQHTASQPTIIKVEGFLDEEPHIDFDPNYVADFTDVVDWSKFT